MEHDHTNDQQPERHELIIQHSNSDNLELINVKTAQVWYRAFVEFATEILKKDLDYGIIPGTGKPSLYKAGAEKLRFAFGLSTEMVLSDKMVTLSPMFIDYTYKCTVKAKNGQILAQCEGSCNSMEPNYRYQWLERIPAPAKDEADKLKAQKVGKWVINTNKKSGAKSFQWFDRNDNPEIFAKKNTIQKIAQKRAFVGAILLATGASEFFTQDLENLLDDEDLKEPGAGADQGEQFDPEALQQWKDELNKCKTQEQVLALYDQNKDAILASEILKGLFKTKQDEIKKPSSTDKAKKAADDLEQKIKGKK